jgi:hypothetical protein
VLPSFGLGTISLVYLGTFLVGALALTVITKRTLA